ncbi:MAG TPA: hypothetical protein VNF46_01085 [Gammaproteobacteria bacterium]|nr:hypothetical protein [Gammaproteobacteria bacterium]
MSSQGTSHSLGRVPPSALGKARRLLHIAVQAVGNAGRVFLPATTDYSHISLVWDSVPGGLVGGNIPAPGGALRAVLQFDAPAVALLKGSGGVLGRWPLEGLMLPQLETEMRQVFASRGLNGDAFSVRSVNPIDGSVLDAGERFAFAAQRAAVRELGAYYGMSAAALGEFARTLKTGGTPHVWPHHFDYSLLTPLDKSGGEGSRSITLGMSPGDGYYDQPYFYATPWPYPTVKTLPAMQPPARWHQHEWTGVVLAAADFLSLSPGSETLTTFWRQAFGVLRGLLTPV